MSPASRSKSKDKRVGPVGKEPPKASSKSSGPTNTGNAYDPHLGTFHALEPTAVTSAPALQSNGRFRSIDETDDNCGSSLGTGGEYDAASNNGSWSGESEDHKEKASNLPVRQEAIPGADNDKREKIRQKNEKKHQRQKERRAQELHERCSGYLMSRKLEALAQQLVAMGFSSERATMALILNEGRVEESVSWLFEGGEEADKHRSEKLNGGSNLKIDITEEIAQITCLEMKYKCSKQEVERAIVASEGDIAKAEETLRAQRQDWPSTPPNSEETYDLPTISSNGKLPASISQNSLRASTRSSSSSTTQQRRDEKDFNYTKSSAATIGGVSVSSEPGSKNVQQPLKGIQPKLEWARQQQQIVMQEDKRLLTAGSNNSSHGYSMASQLHMSQLAAKPETRYAALGNESKNLLAGPVIVMQRPQSINLKQASSTSMMNSSSPPPGTTAGWYHSNFEIPKSNGGLSSPNIPSTRSLNLNTLYHQHHYQQFMPSSSPVESSPVAHRGNGNGLRSRISTSSPTLAAASSLGLFSGLGSTVSSGPSSPVDWSTGGQMQLLDYTNIDWTLDRNLSNGGRPIGGGLLWQGAASSYMHDDSNAAASVGGGSSSNPTMRNRMVPPNGHGHGHGNGIPIPGLQGGGGGGSATAEASSSSSSATSRDWTSPFEERDLFSLPRRFVFSPTL